MNFNSHTRIVSNLGRTQYEFHICTTEALPQKKTGV